MERKYQLSVTSDTTDINVNSVDADEVARIVQLAGVVEPRNPQATINVTPADPISASPVASNIANPIDQPEIDPEFDANMDMMRKNAGMPAVQRTNVVKNPNIDTALEPSMDTTVDTDIDDSMQDEMDEMLTLDEDVAEYDYGHRKFKDEGEEIDEPDLIWQAVENPQRIKGSPGDNGLIQELHSQLIADYASYLAETERENDTGVMSPLSDPTKPSFDKDPLSDEDPVDDGSHSPMSTIVRQYAFK